ncbi:MAG TPA: Xaa-Pro peptidase family protein [Anaerolineaceae bacterium]|jgi:Xaa-Pro aminopeptidase
MKSDLERLMTERGLDALLITGPGMNNPAMVYFTGVTMLTAADLIIRRGEAPVLFYQPMERDSAAKTGLQRVSYLRYPLTSLLKETGGSRTRARGLRYAHMFSGLGMETGRVAVYGAAEIGPVFGALMELRSRLPGLELVGEADDSLLFQTRATKDPTEVDRIRRMGQVTTQVVDELIDYLTTRSVKDDCLVDSAGAPLKLGVVKRMIDGWLSERGAETPEETIFSIGRDAAVPHNPGNPEDRLRLGQTIVLDIFPREKGGGYFYDFTRTWCLGYATDEAQALYEQVRQVYREMSSAVQPGALGSNLQAQTCGLFEVMGHPTLRTDVNTEQGYVHGLGHGVGLNIHEMPFLTHTAGELDVILPGSVVTVEPGLYYPERGMGVRLEDTLWVSPEGKAAPVVEYPMELVLPIRGFSS